MLGRVVRREPGAGQHRQQQQRNKRARTAAVSEAQPHTGEMHAAHIHAEHGHPKVNPISLAPAPSSQLAVT